MKTKPLYLIWGAMFVLCAGLGFLPEPEGALKVLMVVLSSLFFLPPMLLAHFGSRFDAALVRDLSAIALALDCVLLVLNILAASFTPLLGDILYYILVIAGSPMICSRYWALVLFLWAYVMIFSHKELRTK